MPIFSSFLLIWQWFSGKNMCFCLFFIPSRSHDSATCMVNSVRKYIWFGWHVCVFMFPTEFFLMYIQTLYNHHQELILEQFHQTKKSLHPSADTHHPSSTALGKHQAIFDLCRFGYSDYSIKWNSTLWIHLLLTSFTEHVFKIHPCCIIYQSVPY